MLKKQLPLAVNISTVMARIQARQDARGGVHTTNDLGYRLLGRNAQDIKPEDRPRFEFEQSLAEKTNAYFYRRRREEYETNCFSGKPFC